MIHYLIDLWSDWRGFKPPSDPFEGKVGSIPPFDEFRRNYPNHIAARLGRGPIRHWTPKAGDWRRACRAVLDAYRTAPQYRTDADLQWSPSDTNCVGMSLRMMNLLSYSGVPADCLTLIACRINGADHVVAGIHLYGDKLAIVDMADTAPKPWRSTGIYGLIALT